MEFIRDHRELVKQIFLKSRNEQGAFLVEILVSVVILGVVGLVIFNSIASSNLQNRKSNSNAETITRLTSAAEILAATPFSPCSQGNPNPYQGLAESIKPVEIAAIYGVTKNGSWSFCLNNYRDELLASEGVASPWPADENASRIQKVILRSPSGLMRSVFKSFDNKLGNYGLGGTFKTIVTTIPENVGDPVSTVTNITLEVGVTQTFKLNTLNPKNASNNILYFITQGSSDLYSSPAIKAEINGDILTILAPKFIGVGSTRNTSGRANIDIEAFDTVAALQATPASLGISVIIPPLQTVIKTPLVTLIKDIAQGNFQPIEVKGVYDPFTFKLISPPLLTPGIIYNSSNSVFSGIPNSTWPSTTYTVEVTDSTNTSVNGSFNLQVVDQLSISNEVTGRTFYTGSVITNFYPFDTKGGLSPYTYTVTPALPEGLIINPISGLISGTPTRATATQNYTITVSDNKISGYVGQSKSHTFSMRVLAPLTVFVAIPTKVSVQNSPTSFTPVTAAGGDSPYTFSISPALPTGLSMDSTSGLISGTPTALSAATTYTVTVRDSVTPTANTASATFSLRVVERLNIGAMITGRTFYRGSAITAFTPNSSPTGGVPPYTYSISPALPAGLSLNTGTGQISGTPTAGSSLQSYIFTIRDATLSGYISQSDTGTFNMRVFEPFTATTVVSTKVVAIGSPTSFTPVTAAGGDSPYTFSISPALPTGLSMDSTSGLISGTPTALSAATTYTVTVRDSVTPTANTASATFSLRVVEALQISNISSGMTFYTGVSVSQYAFTTTGGLTPYQYSISPALPSGLTFNTTSGLISGTPTTKIALTLFRVTVQDSSTPAQSRYAEFNIRVLDKLLVTAVNSSWVFYLGIPVNELTVTAQGGIAPYSYNLVAGALPEGLTFNRSTGVITGTPTKISSSASYTVTVNDSVTPQNNSSSVIFTIRVRS